MYALIVTKGGKDHERWMDLLGELRVGSVLSVGSKAAFKHLAEKDPDFIVLDDDMPPVEDVEFLLLVKRLSKAPIMVIGEKRGGHVVAALAQGADAYVSPAVTNEEFLARVRGVMRRGGPLPEDLDPEGWKQVLDSARGAIDGRA